MQLRLKEIRLKRKLTQKKLAEVIGCSVGAYSKYEVGDREPPLDVLCKLADYYDISVDYLIGREVSSMDGLSRSEIILVEKYRRSDRLAWESALEIMDVLDKRYKAYYSRIAPNKKAKNK